VVEEEQGICRIQAAVVVRIGGIGTGEGWRAQFASVTLMTLQHAPYISASGSVK
jgi:hypothetical protein